MWVLWMLEKSQYSSREATGIQAGDLAWMNSLLEHMGDLNLPTTSYLIADTGREHLDTFEDFRRWCRHHKPEDPGWSNLGKKRTLTPIETWTRPH